MAGNTDLKLFHYNMSWVNQCHDTQIEFKDMENISDDNEKTVNNVFLSENNAIMQKAIDIEKSSTTPTYSDITNKNGTNFKILRRNFFNKQIEVLKQTITDKDFLSLVELLIHVPNTNHANYDHCIYNSKKYDLTTIQENQKKKADLDDADFSFKNEDYGVLKMINALKLYDIDENNNKEGTTHTIVYDNVINTGLDPNNRFLHLRPFGEGIGIVFKNDLFDTQFIWNQKDNPVVKEIIKKYETIDENKIGDKKVHYYSNDLGPEFCGNNYITPRGTPDSGRSFIMTAGLKHMPDNKKKLIILISFHGPNILNLVPTESNLKKNFGINVENEEEYYKKSKYQLKMLIDNNPSVQQKLISDLKEMILDQIYNGIASINTDEIHECEHCEIMLGCDANDANGEFLTMLKGGFELNNEKMGKVKLNNSKVSFNISNSKNDSTKNVGKYEDLYTCCANTDSLIYGNRKLVYKDADDKDQNMTSTGDLKEKRYDYVTNNYPSEFTKHQKFGYNGDYVVYGTTIPNDKNYSIQKYIDDKNNDKFNYEGVMSSDHLAVFSELVRPKPNSTSDLTTKSDTTADAATTADVDSKKGGKRRTRRRRRSTRRKRRMSRRRRRSTRRKR